MDKIVEQLVSEMARMAVIDSHEHLPREAEVLKQVADVFTRIYCHYSITPAVSSGMPGDRLALKDTSIPLEERWRRFAPYRQAMEHTGYARAARIAARDLFGIEEINDRTYLELSNRIAANNTPGLYDRVLCRKCRIETVLNQGSWDDGAGGCARRVSRELVDLHQRTGQKLEQLRQRWEIPSDACRTGRDLVDHVLGRLAAAGAVGVKLHARTLVRGPVAEPDGQALFLKALAGNLANDEGAALAVWLMEQAMALAPKHRLVIAVHCGLNWCNWVDFTGSGPMTLVPYLLRYRQTTFDLYHGGIPWVREMAVVANQYPNAHLDLTWCHQISPYMTEQMLNEWIDLVPLNKVIGFGGDNVMGPEKTYAALVMARENIARALAVRVHRGQMSESRAAEVCRLWLYDNPKRIYGL